MTADEGATLLGLAIVFGTLGAYAVHLWRARRAAV